MGHIRPYWPTVKWWRDGAGQRRLDLRLIPSLRLWRRRVVPYSSWLSSGDNAWQMTAATLVGLMSIPALAVLYGGIVQRKWAINTTMMVFCSFALTLIVWVLWAFKMGFGSAWIGTFIGKPGTVGGAAGERARAQRPLLNRPIAKIRIT